MLYVGFVDGNLKFGYATGHRNASFVMLGCYEVVGGGEVVVVVLRFKSTGYNCRVFLYRGRVLLVRPKMLLADDGNYRESRY